MLLLIGVLIGLVLGLTGAGGSVFAVPLLMLLGGMPMSVAVGVSLAAVSASSLYGSLRNGLSKRILWLPGSIFALTGALAAPWGSYLSQQLPEAWLVSGFAALALVIALRMWLGASHDPASAQVVRAGDFRAEVPPGLVCKLSRSGQFELRPRCIGGLVTGGLLTGLLAGLFGVGGGFLIVPLLLVLSPITISQAVSTSLLVIALVSGAAFFSHVWFNGITDWTALGQVVAGGVAGMFLGQLLSLHIANARLQKLFALALVLISVLSLFMHWMR